jgi:hypothetical protein
MITMTYEEKQAFYYEKIIPMMNLCFKKEESIRVLIITDDVEDTLGILAAHYKEVQEYLKEHGDDPEYHINFRLELEVTPETVIVKSVNPETGDVDFTYRYMAITEKGMMHGVRQDIALIANGFWEITMLRTNVERIAQLVSERDYLAERSWKLADLEK